MLPESPLFKRAGGLPIFPSVHSRNDLHPERRVDSRCLCWLMTAIALAGLVSTAGCGGGSSSGGGGAPVGNQHYVSLEWQPSTSVVVGYYVYRGATPDTLSKLTGMIDTATSYSDSSVVNGQTYVYAVTAVDSENVESALSTSVTVMIPGNQ